MPGRLALVLRFLPALPRLLALRAGSRTSVADRFEERVRRDPQRSFVLFEGRRTSYAEANADANRVAHWAEGIGLRTGDVVALLMENRPEYLSTWLGLAKLGVTIALINTNLTGRALRHAIGAADARHLVVGSECLDRYATCADELEHPLQVFVRADAGNAATGPLPAGAEDLDALLADEFDVDPDPGVRATLRTGDPLFYIYTSGTTGLPKAARFSHLRFLSIGELTALSLELTRDDVFYDTLPLYHSAGGVMVVGAVIASGATIALRRKFSARSFWKDVRESQATVFQYIGEFCRYLMNVPPQPGDRDHRIRAIIGNGLRPDIWEAFQQRFGIETIREFYGATEGNAAIVNFENKVGSVGRMPIRALDLSRIVRYDVASDEPVRGPDGFCIECAPNEPGELLAKISQRDDRATGRFEGYTSKEATERKILRDVFEHGDAWFRSGDLLRKDRDGFYYFVDRIGDTFRWKGENVSTQEVAESLSGFSGIDMINVYGVEVEGADGRAGMAALLLAEGSGFDGAAFYAHVEEHLPRYAAPQFVRILADQEMTGTFKIRKVDLQREGFDPARVGDPLFVRDETSGAYVPLTPDRFTEIREGARKL